MYQHPETVLYSIAGKEMIAMPSLHNGALRISRQGTLWFGNGNSDLRPDFSGV
jgi:hypothetical protein